MDTNQATPKSDRRSITSAQNGKLGGRPYRQIDRGCWDRLATRGVAQAIIADALGISVRTLQRRVTERRNERDPLYW